MSWSLSSRGSPFGILDVKRGGIESWELLLLVLLVELATATLLAKLRGTRPGKDVGRGEGVGETPSVFPGDLESSLRAPGVRRPSSLGVLQPSSGVWRSVWGVSDLVVLGDPGVLRPARASPWLAKGNPPANNDCSKLFLQEANISSLRELNPDAA